MKLLALLIACAALLAGASPASACAVCFDIADRAREAYYLTTVLMIIVPFAFLGGIILWLRRAMRRQAALHNHRASQGTLRDPEVPTSL